jgi:hypothetical protein
MKFAYEPVAVAMSKNRDQGMHTAEEFLKKAFTFLVDAMNASIDAVQIVTTNELFDQFT